jgi:hypothetical protein
MKSLRAILAIPAFHALVGCVFAVSFVWPFVAFTRPVTVFCSLMGSWAASIFAAFLLSQGLDEGPAGDPEENGSDTDV